MQTTLGSRLTRSIRSEEQSTQPGNRCCRAFDGVGWIVRDVDGLGRKAFPCDCQIRAQVLRRIPPLYRNARLADFKAATIDRVMEFFSKPDSLGLLISGPTGVGK